MTEAVTITDPRREGDPFTMAGNETNDSEVQPDPQGIYSYTVIDTDV
jgi:hypothetical protein